jgi:predicted transcriptional regulator
MTLKEVRTAVGLSQRKLDKLSGLPIGTVCALEDGRNSDPAWSVVAAVVGALRQHGLPNLTAGDLFPHQTEVRS